MNKFQKLSRAEMKNVKGGQPPPPPQCTVGSACTAWYFDGRSNTSYPGTCNGGCECIPDAGGLASGGCTNL